MSRITRLFFLSCGVAAGSREQLLDKLTGGAIARARGQSHRFRGREGQLLMYLALRRLAAWVELFC